MPSAVRSRTAPAPPPSSPVARIQEELHALALSLESARREFADCCLHMVGENPDLGAAERLHQAEIARDALDRRGTQLRTALQAAHERDLSDANTAATAARAAGWRDAERASERMQADILKLGRSVGLMANNYRRVLLSRERLQAALPRRPDPQAWWLHRDDTEIRLRREFVRCGLGWACPLPFGVHGLPTLEDEAAGVVTATRRWATENTGE